MKMTERDKVLLVLLGVILIVALAVMVPSVGVMACRDKLAEIETKDIEIQNELDQANATLKSMGVTKYQENASSAVDALSEKVFDLKVEASHLAGNVMAYAKPYAVDEEWVDGLEYRYGIKSDEGEKIMQYSPIEEVEGGKQEEETFVIDGVTYTLPCAKREINYAVPASAECYYVTEVAGADVSFADLGSLILYLHNISSKGSILVTEVRHSGNDGNRISFTLVMPPEGSGISRYAQDVQEELARRAAEEGDEEEEE